jgi:hypothetical protein
MINLGHFVGTKLKNFAFFKLVVLIVSQRVYPHVQLCMKKRNFNQKQKYLTYKTVFYCVLNVSI